MAETTPDPNAELREWAARAAALLDAAEGRTPRLGPRCRRRPCRPSSTSSPRAAA
jgi:hypothetical protein